MKELVLPPHYDPAKARDSQFIVTDTFGLQRQAEAWAAQQQLQPVGSDQVRIHLLQIDQQFDFGFQAGSLFVGGHSGSGAMDDQDRWAQFVYRNLGVISEITCTMDTHLPWQVFFPSAHLRADGSTPEPYTVISAEEYARGEYRPNPAFARQIGADPVWLQKQMVFYCQQLEASGKYQLTLWPYHGLIGSGGHRLSGVVDEARLFHAFGRGAANIPEVKGGNPLTEHYSIFQPEVMSTWDGRAIPGVQKNTRLIEILLKSDYVVIAGEAASHCLAWTVDDLLTEIAAQDPALARKVYILEDCTSPVVVPGGPDYTPQAEAALDKFRNAGMNVVRSTDPLESWEGIRL